MKDLIPGLKTWRMFRRLTVLTALCLVLASCGVKAPPLPADVLLPVQVSQPVFRFEETGLLLVTFYPPTKNKTGLPLKHLSGFYVERSENRLRPEFCTGCPVEYTERFDIKAKPPPPGRTVAEVPYSFEDRLQPGYIYYYRIYAHDDDGDYDPAFFRTLQVSYDTPLNPPDSLRADVSDRLVILHWASPDRLTDGRPGEGLVGYNLYRRNPDGPWSLLTPDKPWPSDSYEDPGVANGQTYEYMARSVRLWQGTTIEGPPSEVVSAKPVDLTPPPPPANVYSASMKDGVQLTWTEVTVPDLAGYRIYRRSEGESAFRKIVTDLVRDNLFTDNGVRQGITYYYHVTSVDNSPAANESEPSPDTRIRYEP